MRAKALLEDCPWTSSLCKPCFDPSRAVQEVDTSTIFKEHGWYASFAKISDEAVSMLWDLVRLPFDVSTTVLEHAFISNLKDPMVTAGIHANPSTSSMAVQVLFLLYIYMRILNQDEVSHYVCICSDVLIVCWTQDLVVFLLGYLPEPDERQPFGSYSSAEAVS